MIFAPDPSSDIRESLDDGIVFKESDKRVSAKSIGYISGIILIALFASFFLMDLKTLYKHSVMCVRRNIRNKQH